MAKMNKAMKQHVEQVHDAIASWDCELHGLERQKSGHFKAWIVHKSGKKARFGFPCSPSDHRSVKNSLAQAKRAARELAA